MGSLTNPRQKAFYSFGNLANGAYNGINNAVLGPFLSHFTSNAFIIAYLGNTRTIDGVVIQPLVGRWSDRTSGRLGRRRPFILVGIPLAIFFLMLVPTASHAQKNLEVPLIAASIILFSIFWNVAQDTYSSLMVDITPESERSLYNSLLSVLALVGQVALVVLAFIVSFKKNTVPDVLFYAVGVFMLICYIVVFFGVREPAGAALEAKKEERVPLRIYIADLHAFREAQKLLMSIFFLWTGLNAILPFLTLIPSKILGVSTSQSYVVYGVMILSAAIWAYPFGWLASRYGKRPMIVVGTVLLILAAFLGLIVPSYFWFFPLAFLAGTGFSATTALTYPYLAQLVPESKIGIFTGLQTSFSAVAVPISASVTALLINHFGYRSTFALLAVGMVLDLIVLLSIDEHAAQTQVLQVEAAEGQIIGTVAPLPAV
jgi:Na+/melibiose symporter-like transporter